MKIKLLALNSKYDPENQCSVLFLISPPSTEDPCLYYISLCASNCRVWERYWIILKASKPGHLFCILLELNHSHSQTSNMGMWRKRNEKEMPRVGGRGSGLRKRQKKRRKVRRRKGAGRRGRKEFPKRSGLQGETRFSWFTNYSGIFYLQVRWVSYCLSKGNPGSLFDVKRW